MVFGFGWQKHYTLSQIPDLSGKVAVVTGANSGLGLEVSKQLALSGAKVFLGVRNHAKGANAKQQIDAALADPSLRRHQGGSAELLAEDVSLELSDMAKVKAWAERVKSSTSRLDILVCGAAIVPSSFSLAPTTPNHELTYSTNHLGHFFLVSQLLPLLRSTAATPGADVRIVIVAADVTAHVDTLGLVGDRDWLLDQPTIDSGRGWSRLNAYARTKMCNVLFARRLAALTREVEGLRTNTLHAGVFFSDIFFADGHQRDHGAEVGMWERWTKGAAKAVGGAIAMSPEESGLTTLFAATSSEIQEKDYRGEFFTPYGILSTSKLCKLCLDDSVAEELWAKSIQQLKAAGEHDVFADLAASSTDKPAPSTTPSVPT